MSSRRDQCLLLPALDYATEIRLKLEYLQEAQDHLRSMQQ